MNSLGEVGAVLADNHHLPTEDRAHEFLRLARCKAFCTCSGREPRRRRQRGDSNVSTSTGIDLSIVAIIPLYNGARWIEQSLSSVLAQTLPPSEIVVVNDGSIDGGRAVVERMVIDHPRITLLHKPNGGQSSARNMGVAQSSSALIELLDQDDAWYPNHLERLIQPFKTGLDPQLGWTYSNLDEIDAAGTMVTHAMLDHLTSVHPKRSLIDCLGLNIFVVPTAAMISRKAFEAVGGFDERLCGYEDDDLFMRIFRAGWDYAYVPERLSQWRIHSGSTYRSVHQAVARII